MLTVPSTASEKTAAEPVRKYAANFTAVSATPTPSATRVARDSSAGTWRNISRIAAILARLHPRAGFRRRRRLDRVGDQHLHRAALRPRAAGHPAGDRDALAVERL